MRRNWRLLIFVGLALNVAVLAPAIFSASVRRRTTWSGLIISFLVYSFSYLLVIPWQKLQSQSPPFGLCFAQATLVYASPSLVTMSYIAFVIDFYLQMAAITFWNKKIALNARPSKLLAIFPWVVFFGVIVLVVGVVREPSTVGLTAGRFYCHATTTQVPTIFNVILIVSVGVVLFPLE